MPAEKTRKVRRSARDDVSWSAWICDRDRLLRLSEAMERCVAPIRDARAASPITEGASTAPVVAAGGDATVAAAEAGPPVDDWDEFEVQMLARHSHLNAETMGPPSMVLEDLDSSGLESVTLTVGTHDGVLLSPTRMLDFELLNLRPSIRRNGEDKWFAYVRLSKLGGAALHVDGTDPDWVASTFTKLRHECEKAVPWWWWLRHGWAWVGYTLIALGIAAFALEPTLGGGRSLLWVLASSAVALTVGSATFSLARRVLPGFELLSQGQSGKGSTVLTFLLALVAQAPVGVLVNVMTD